MFDATDPVLALLNEAVRPIRADVRRWQEEELRGDRPGSPPQGGLMSPLVIDVILSGFSADGVDPTESTRSPYHRAQVSLEMLRARVATLTGRRVPLATEFRSSDKDANRWKSFARAVSYASEHTAASGWSRRVDGAAEHDAVGRKTLSLDIDDDVMDVEFAPAQYEALAQWCVFGKGKCAASPRKPQSAVVSFIGLNQHDATTGSSAAVWFSPSRGASTVASEGGNTTASPRNHHHLVSAASPSAGSWTEDSVLLVSQDTDAFGDPPLTRPAPSTVNVCGVEVSLNPQGHVDKSEVRRALHQLGYTTVILDDDTFDILFKDADQDSDNALLEEELALLLTSFGEDTM